MALDSRHDGNGTAVNRLEHGVEAHRVLDVLVVVEVDRRALPVHVGPGAEAWPLALEPDGACVTDVDERPRQLCDQGRVECIPALGARERDAEDVPLPLDPERAHRRQLRVHVVLKGALAAAVTPLRDGGDTLDEAPFGAYLEFLAAAGLDGILALGTTGEGILLAPDERRRSAELFVTTAGDRLDVAVHCGAQTTRETVALARHAAEAGAAAVAVIGPPYYALDDQALLAHFGAAAQACAPLPFYLYEFADRSGYAVPVDVVERLREQAPNLAGLKVSDAPFDRFSPYLLEGLDVFVGPESLIVEGLARGAAGVVSGLASAFPDIVGELVRTPNRLTGERVAAVRDRLQALPFQAALKRTLARRGVPLGEDVRAPLRGLTPEERRNLDEFLDEEGF
jgi:dihydrodipicolinate synthase/N-acetylneuraminate lyase